jgi:hypothetical protein
MSTAPGGRDGRRLDVSRFEAAVLLAFLLVLLAVVLWSFSLVAPAKAAVPQRARGGHVGVVVAVDGRGYTTLELAAQRSKRAPLFTHPIRKGSVGRQVLAFKWLAAGHKPSVYHAKIRFPVTPGDQCGKKCVQEILDLRWQLGEPVAYQKHCPDRTGKQPTFGRNLYLIVTGRKPRPACWVGRSSQRIAAVRRQRASQATPCAKRIIRFALHELALGVHEIPDRSNDGPRIRYYQEVTGAYGCPGAHYECPSGQWCASFVQRDFVDSGVGPIANRSAFVFYIVDWAHAHGWLRASPAVGAEVAFMRNFGHTGIVVGVSRTTFTTVEGNSGNAVRMHVYPLGYQQTVFIYPPCLNTIPHGITTRGPH